MGCTSSITCVADEPINNNDKCTTVHSPSFTIGKTTYWSTHKITSLMTWKEKMHVYLDGLIMQMNSYDINSHRHMIDKLNRFQNSSGIPYRYSSNLRHNNAIREVSSLFMTDNIVNLAHFYDKVMGLLDVYVMNKRIEDFEEIVYVLTIIINHPVILKNETRWGDW
jgi:hypothetical protein